jgi:catechol 2,3-dioxygenase-like lactoylglutathione lyase family enzyme
MIDHMSIVVNDIEQARAFYDAVLGPLGYGRVMEFDHANLSFTGYGPPERPAFWICGGYGPANPAHGVHTAFLAPDRAAVDMFHREAMARGARDDGAPGLRPEYHPNYYGAFVFDPDGHKIEAVCHAPGTFEDQFRSA